MTKYAYVADADADAENDADEMPIVVTTSSTTSSTNHSQRRLRGVNHVAAATWGMLHAVEIFLLVAATMTLIVAFIISTTTVNIRSVEPAAAAAVVSLPPPSSLTATVVPRRRGLWALPAFITNIFDSNDAAASLTTTTMTTSASSTAVVVSANAAEQSQSSSSSIMRCNGLANLCNVPVNQALFLTLHNAMASADEGFVLFPNHNTRLEQALLAGFRGLNLDVGTCDGQVALYHTFCWLGSRQGETVFQNIASFLDDNPHEVLLLTFQLQDNVSLDAVYQSMDAAGLAKHLYVHDPSSSSWPTLESLITEHQKRVVLFHYNGDNHCNADDSFPACPAGMHYWYQYGVNTQFQFDSLVELQDDAYACQLMATPGVSQSTRDFFKLNLFLTIPSQVQSADVINTLTFAREQMTECSNIWGIEGGGGGGTANDDIKVSMIVHDFWEEGSLLQLAQAYNEQLGGGGGDETSVAGDDDDDDDNDDDDDDDDNYRE